MPEVGDVCSQSHNLMLCNIGLSMIVVKLANDGSCISFKLLDQFSSFVCLERANQNRINKRFFIEELLVILITIIRFKIWVCDIVESLCLDDCHERSLEHVIVKIILEDGKCSCMPFCTFLKLFRTIWDSEVVLPLV